MSLSRDTIVSSMVIVALSTKADTMTFRKVQWRASKVKGGFYPFFRRDKDIQGNQAGDMWPRRPKKTGISVYTRGSRLSRRNLIR